MPLVGETGLFRKKQLCDLLGGFHIELAPEVLPLLFEGLCASLPKHHPHPKESAFWSAGACSCFSSALLAGPSRHFPFGEESRPSRP
jgi:hypothetical protein